MTLRTQKITIKVGKAVLGALLSAPLTQLILNEPVTFVGAHPAVWVITFLYAWWQGLNTWDAFLSDPNTGIRNGNHHETTPPPGAAPPAG